MIVTNFLSGTKVVTDYMRRLVNDHPNKVILAQESGWPYGRVLGFAKGEVVKLSVEEFEQLANYFGMKIYADIVNVAGATRWIPHPANPAAYEYEVDCNGRSTGKVRPIAKQAAE